MKKPIVFVITPFGEDFIALYDYLKKEFAASFHFTNGGDLDNQQNILQDIVGGIYEADVVIADLTGLNPNVFYELGLAHAMNKKVIIITQDLTELPFDIKSYRANEYSLQFNKLPKLHAELTKLLNGAMDNSVKYGNPVQDYIPRLETTISLPINGNESSYAVSISSVTAESEDEGGDKGILDFIADIEEHSQQMISEIGSIGEELSEMNDAVNSTSKEMERVKMDSGNIDASFTRKICRKLAGPIDVFAQKLETHIGNITTQWSIIENSYLSLLDSPYIQTEDNLSSLDDSITALEKMQNDIDESNKKVESFVEVLKNSSGIERRLTKAISLLIKQVGNYLSMTDTMMSSIDRIITKSEITKKSIVKRND